MQMAFRDKSLAFRVALNLGLVFALAGAMSWRAAAQAPAAAAAGASQLGTVKTVSANTLTMVTDKGQSITVNLGEATKVLQLAVGSTDLKTAKPGQLSDISVGDRALVTGKPGDTAEAMNAARVIVIKSADIAKMQADEQADWKLHGVGGIVSAVDPASGAITLTSGAKKIVIATTGKTEFRRFAGDSVKYQDAKPGTLADIHVGDQLQARGPKSADGASVQAEEVVSGSFKNLSGVIASIDPAGKITFKDLASKKTVTVDVTANSNIRKLSAQMAASFAARSGGSGRRGGGAAAGGGAGQDAAAGAAAGGDAGGMRRAAGADLSQMISRLPTITMADLHKGDAVMIVASEPTPGANTLTAITLLSGVDPILEANPNGGMDLSMSFGGGGGGE
jgi:hypothetical protein